MHDNVKDCLMELLAFNDPESKNFTVKEDLQFRRPGTMKDLKEINTEDLRNLADLLGMTNLYL